MPSIPKQRRIIDRATLVGQLDALIAGDGRPQQVRAELLAMLKTAMAMVGRRYAGVSTRARFAGRTSPKHFPS